MTLGLTDGKTLWAVRYASDGDAPTLYHSPDVEELAKLNPAVAGRFTHGSRAIVSEPMGEFGNRWPAIPQSSSITLREGELTIGPFAPSV